MGHKTVFYKSVVVGIVLISLVFISGCEQFSVMPPEVQCEYLPLSIGSKWVYDYKYWEVTSKREEVPFLPLKDVFDDVEKMSKGSSENPDESGEYTIEVLSQKDGIYTLRVHGLNTYGDVINDSTRRVSSGEDGIFRYEEDSNEKKAVYTPTDNVFDRHLFFTAGTRPEKRGERNQTVPMGTYTTLWTESHVGRVTSWYGQDEYREEDMVQGIGLVKMYQKNITATTWDFAFEYWTWELKSYTPAQPERHFDLYAILKQSLKVFKALRD